MYLSEEKSQIPSISTATLIHWGFGIITVGLVGLIIFESLRLTHKPTTAFERFVIVADFSRYDKCVKNKGGEGCKKYVIQEWEKIYGN